MFSLDGNGKIIVDPNCLMIPSLNKIWTSDKSKTKEIPFSIFSGVYFLCNPLSPYWGWQEEKKKEELQKVYFDRGKVKIKDKDIQEVIKDYLEFLNITPKQFVLEAAKETLYKLANHLKSVPVTSGKDGNILQIGSTMDRVSKMLASYDNIKEAVDKERKSGSGKRGDHEQGYDEDED